MFVKANSPHAAAAGKSVIGFNLIGNKEVEGDLSLIQAKSAADHRDLVGMFPDSGEKDVARAAKAAADAFPAWSAAPLEVRTGLVLRTATTLTRNRDVLVRILMREVGFTQAEAEAEMQETLDAFAHFAAEAPRRAEGIPPRRPVGVCGLLATGTSPLAAPSRKLLPALLSGNTVAWKPSDNAPTAAYLLVRAFMEVGLPAGVLNTVNGRGRAGCGKHFLAGIEKGHFQAFAFVGSVALGRHVAEVCGRNLMVPSLDLAGRGALVVLPDADLDRAVQDAAAAAFAHAGQRLQAVGNLILHEGIAAEFQRRLLAHLDTLAQGNPMTEPDVVVGPLMNARLAHAFKDHWEAGRTAGATLLAGGEAWSDANRTSQVKGNVAHGFYPQPCVWGGVTPELPLFAHQGLGPSVNLCVVKDFDQALDWARRTPYHGSASLYTEDRAAAERFLREIHTDFVGLNQATAPAAARLPFTGTGTRPGSQDALEAFTRLQWIAEAGFTPRKGRKPAPKARAKAAPLAATQVPMDWDCLR